MDRVVGVTLITQTFQKDSIGQEVPTETQKNVIGYKTSISGSEINEAGQRGIMPDCRVEVWTSEYNGAEIVELETRDIQYIAPTKTGKARPNFIWN